MKVLSLISRLLDYPTDELVQHTEELLAFVDEDAQLTETSKLQLKSFIQCRFEGDLLDWQSEYDGLFERGRSVSLLLYEHIHGESRDRGQAMVDLLEQYKAAGLDIGIRELPDYIPLFLEFVATQGTENAKGWLQDVAPVLATIAVRLRKRDSNYASLFESLLQLCDADIDLDAIKEQIKGEQRDDTPKAIDKVWEEEAVTFGGDATNGGCPSQVNRPSKNQRRDQDVPIQFIDAAQTNAPAQTHVS